MPTCRAVLRRPDASPASSRATPAVAATATGVIANPIPSPLRRNGPRRSATKVLSGVNFESQNRPTPAVTVPASNSGLAPQRVTARDAIWDPAASTNVIGKKAIPATIGL